MTAPDIIDRYLAMLTKLERRGRWKISGAQRRIVALVLASVHLDDPYGALEDAATVLRKKSGWFGPLNSPLRYSVAAMIIRRGLPPGRVHDRTQRILEQMKGRGLPWGGPARVLAAVVLALHGDGGRVPNAVFDRMREIHRLWKADHPWITGADDYPMLALHAVSDEPVGALSDRIEGTYQELRASGLPRGNALQLATHILAVLPWRPGEAAGRFTSILHAFEANGESTRRSRFDEFALLALVPDAPDRIVTQVLRDRDRLRLAKPRPTKEVAFGVATGLSISRFDKNAARRLGLGELSALRQVQAVLEAQQAAMSMLVAGSVASSGS